MKNRKMLDAMGLADEKYVSEADPTKSRSVAKSKFRWVTVLSAAACFLLILNIAIIVPILANKDEAAPPDNSGGLNHIQNGGDIIQNNPSSSTPPTQSTTDHIKNPADKGGEEDGGEEYTPDLQFLKNPQLLGALDTFFKNGSSDFTQDEPMLKDEMDKVEESEGDLNDALSPDGSTVSPDLNDNQVAGISEADIAKRSDKHLFYLRGTTLYVYSINGAASKAECILPLGGYLDKAQELAYSLLSGDLFEELDPRYQWEMYLTPDYKTLTIIVKTASYPAAATGIVTLDVSNAPTVEFKSFKIFSGEYVTSRVVGDEILLFTKYSVPKRYDKENPMSYIPFYTENDETYYTNDIYFPSELSANTYITVTRLNQKKLRVLESVSYLSYSDNIYVSAENVYLTREIPLSGGVSVSNDFIEDLKDPSNNYRKFEPIDTEVAAIGYKSALFQNKGTVTVKGYVHNQYSLDEHEGILRVVTTSYIENNNGKATTYDSSASLWCVDLSTMEVAASVENFAPTDDVVRSVRFDGTMAYVCTSLQQLIFSDPVFFFGLSDLENITYTDTGIIDGYSSSLINIGGGYLVGIGYGDKSSTLKIEVYKEENDTVVTVCVEEFSSTSFSTEYKAYYVDRENHLLGLAISTYSSDTRKYEDSYLLLHFNGECFDNVMALGIAHGSVDSVRAFYEEKFFYIVTDTEFNAFEVGRLSALPFVSTDGEATGAADGVTSTDQSQSRPSGPAWPSA